MNYNLKNRSFLKLLDFTPGEIEYLIDLAADLKKAKYNGSEKQMLRGKNIALIFEKTSTRTRCAFEVAAYDQGAHITYLGPTGSQMGHKETMKDTARVLGRLYDGIEYRGFGQKIVEELAIYAGVPVWNGLTDEFHPTQVLADLLTAREKLAKSFRDMIFVYVGDGRNNMANSLLVGGVKLGMDIRIVAPVELHPDAILVEQCREIARETRAAVTITPSIDEGVKGADVLYTDVWVSMGEKNWEQRIRLLQPYQVNKEMMVKTGNSSTIFMHCLPSYHNTDTAVGKEIFEKYGLREMEVTDEVFESTAAVVFEESENRMHTIKAIMVATLT
ncbi:MAG: ornithine carbamoyltransferase [Candidatus Cloacimonetes bacterium]|nr:ornithine carbamoyltransferase [Candidatus Cloacimonadota bacterium]